MMTKCLNIFTVLSVTLCLSFAKPIINFEMENPEQQSKVNDILGDYLECKCKSRSRLVCPQSEFNARRCKPILNKVPKELEPDLKSIIQNLKLDISNFITSTVKPKSACPDENLNTYKLISKTKKSKEENSKSESKEIRLVLDIKDRSADMTASDDLDLSYLDSNSEKDISEPEITEQPTQPTQKLNLSIELTIPDKGTTVPPKLDTAKPSATNPKPEFDDLEDNSKEPETSTSCTPVRCRPKYKCILVRIVDDILAIPINILSGVRKIIRNPFAPPNNNH